MDYDGNYYVRSVSVMPRGWGVGRRLCVAFAQVSNIIGKQETAWVERVPQVHVAVFGEHARMITSGDLVSEPRQRGTGGIVVFAVFDFVCLQVLSVTLVGKESCTLIYIYMLSTG